MDGTFLHALYFVFEIYYMGLVLLLLGFVYKLEKTDLWIVPMELGCVFFVLMNMHVKNREEKNIGFFFISVMHVTVFNPELYFDEHNGLLDCLIPICISYHLYCWVETLHGN